MYMFRIITIFSFWSATWEKGRWWHPHRFAWRPVKALHVNMDVWFAWNKKWHISARKENKLTFVKFILRVFLYNTTQVESKISVLKNCRQSAFFMMQLFYLSITNIDWVSQEHKFIFGYFIAFPDKHGSTTPSKDTHASALPIAIGSTAGVIVVILVGALAFLAYKKARRKKRLSPHDSEADLTSNPDARACAGEYPEMTFNNPAYACINTSWSSARSWASGHQDQAIVYSFWRYNCNRCSFGVWHWQRRSLNITVGYSAISFK